MNKEVKKKINLRNRLQGELNLIFIKEFFYFFSVLLILGALVEYFLPGFFLLYFNVSVLMILWLFNLILLLIYVR